MPKNSRTPAAVAGPRPTAIRSGAVQSEHSDCEPAALHQLCCVQRRRTLTHRAVPMICNITE